MPALVLMFQSLIVLSHDPLARIVPVLLKATEMTHFICPYRLAISILASIFQSLIVLSNDPLARIVPLLLIATEVTSLSCPYRLAISIFV